MAAVTLGADEVFGPFALSLPARAANANQMPPDPQQQEDSTMHANNADEDAVTDEEFDAYISERPAVYEAAQESLLEKQRAVLASGVPQTIELTEAEGILYQDWKQGDAGTVRANPVRLPLES